MATRKISLNHLTLTPVKHMTPDEYVQQAMRTRCPLNNVADRVKRFGSKGEGFQIQMAINGLCNEVGELSTDWYKYLYYQEPLDEANMKKELGDIMWHIAELCDALGISLQEVMEGNIRKLRTRFPDKFDQTLAKEENRDRQAEHQAVESADALYNKLSQDAEERFNRAQDDGVAYNAETTE